MVYHDLTNIFEVLKAKIFAKNQASSSAFGGFAFAFVAFILCGGAIKRKPASENAIVMGCKQNM